MKLFSLQQRFKGYLAAGFLIVAPVGITFYLLIVSYQWVTTKLIKAPLHFLGERSGLINHILEFPGGTLVLGIAGIAGSLLLVASIGYFTTGAIGRTIEKSWRDFINLFPIVSSVYNTLSQVLDVLFESNTNTFQQVVLVPFPNNQSTAIGFISSELESAETKYFSVFVPTTPNPTSGYSLMYREDQVTKIEMTVEEAMKYVVSLGVITPDALSNKISEADRVS